MSAASTYDEWQRRDAMADDADRREMVIPSDDELQRMYEDAEERLQRQAVALARYVRVRDNADPYRAVVYDTHWEPVTGDPLPEDLDVRGLPETTVVV